MLVSDNSGATLSTLTLAFVGDAVYETLVRDMLALRGNCPAGRLHEASVKLVNAAAQANAAQVIMPFLSEEEISVFKRGRNAHPAHLPRGARISDYHAATGLETLFGWLHLSGNDQRMKELFEVIIDRHNG